MGLGHLGIWLVAATGCLAVGGPRSIGELRHGLLVSQHARPPHVLPVANGEWQLNKEPSGSDIDPTVLYPAHNFSVPIDHFHNDSRYAPHSDGFFNIRYWFDATYYKPGGPVVVLCSGEDTGDDRLPYLQKGGSSILPISATLS